MDFFTYNYQMLILDLVFGLYAMYDFSFFMLRGSGASSKQQKGLSDEEFDLLADEMSYQDKSQKNQKKKAKDSGRAA